MTAWIKVETNLSSKIEVMQISQMLKISRREVVGLLVEFWSWADSHIKDGDIGCVTCVTIDDHFRQQGFSDSLQKVGWLVFEGDEAHIPNWERHHGHSAKKRAESARTSATYRKRVKESSLESDVKSDAPNVTHASPSVSPREDKRKNIYKTPKESGVVYFRSRLVELGVDEKLANEWIEVRKNKKAALSLGAIDRMLPEVEQAGITMQEAVEICCDRAWQGFKAEWVRPVNGSSNLGAFEGLEL